MTTTRRRLHRTTFGLGHAQHRAALDVASVIKSVERDRKLSDAPWAAEPRLTRDQPQSSGLRSWRSRSGASRSVGSRQRLRIGAITCA